jgi:hypothetical protein
LGDTRSTGEIFRRAERAKQEERILFVEPLVYLNTGEARAFAERLANDLDYVRELESQAKSNNFDPFSEPLGLLDEEGNRIASHP